MAIDLLIGFPEKPFNLPAFLLERNFRLDSTGLTGETAWSTYRLFDEGQSARGVRVAYYDGLEPDEKHWWQKIAPQVPIEATASVSTYMRRNSFDERLQREAARDIRNHYGALLYDPQAARFVHDVTKLTGEGELVTCPIDLPGWYASQWDSRSVAIYTGSNPQPVRIIERPEAWGEQWAWNLCDDGIYFRRGQ